MVLVIDYSGLPICRQ